jgi:hypothetical protein
VVVALAPSLAGADGLSLQIEPDYTYTTTSTTDATGRATHASTEEFAQHYRLNLDRSFTPNVRFAGSGLFEDTKDWITTDGVPANTDTWRASGNARLHLGDPLLGADLGYDRRDESASSALSRTVHDISEGYSAHVGWRPVDLPELDFRASHTENRDVDRRFTDSATNDALLNMNYRAIRQLTLGYSANYQESIDHIGGTTTSQLINNARAAYDDRFNRGRTSVAATYTFANRISNTSVSGSGGNVAVQQLPSAGLSLVETPFVAPESDTLLVNGALIDGNTASSAGLNLGFSPSLAGDSNPRDIGVQFSDPATAVNTLYVYVDRQLPAEIVSAYAWTAYRSDDNVTWTRITITAPVVFGAFQNRFEITIDRTQSRYLKVVTRPLGIAVTPDRRYSDVFVTELQALLVQPAEAVRGRSSSSSHNASAALHQELLDDPHVAYDFLGTANISGDSGNYNLQNALSLDRAFARIWRLASRIARQDTIATSTGASQHTGSWQYSASLTATPLPTLTDSLTYSGQYQTTIKGTAELNSVTFINRATLYRGVNVLTSAGYTYNFLENGATTHGPTVIATATVVPNYLLTLSSSYFYSSSVQSGGGQPESQNDNERVDGIISLTPFAALALSASVSRVIKGTRPTTLATFGGGFTPFPDGSVLLRGSYTETLDTASDLRTHTASAGLHWNVVPSAALDLNYTVLGSSSPVSTTDTKAFTASLVVQL